MRIKPWHGCWLALLTAAWAGEAAAVEPASVLADHMVLQRGKPAPIWGTAKAGEKVTVRFAGQSKTAVADAKGRWMVRLDPLKASAQPRELLVQGPSRTVTFKDVLVGDVWIAGGQSNMGRDVNRSWRPDGQRMDYPHIRFLTVRSRGSKYPQAGLVPPPPPARPPRSKRLTQPNRWYVCTDEATPECCAVGFFFAERIYKATGIPQGLLWNAWAGSTAKEWIPRFGWSLRPELAETARTVDSWYPGTKVGRAAYEKAVADIAAWSRKAEEAVRKGHPFPYPQPMLPEPDDSQGRGRGTTILYNGRVHPLVPYAIAGILWYQGESDYANGRYLHEIEAMAESWRKLFAAPGEKPTDLPFYFVQMQRCGSYMSPGVRDFQFQSYFTIPNAGMAVLLDLDMNLHPANKYDSGRRMALWALAKDYGKDVIYSGPIYRRHRAEGGRIVVELEHTHGGLFIGRKNKLAPPQAVPDGKLINLEITADGRQWVQAQSKIEGEKLIVWADGVSKPAHVRYCWKSKADEPFLYNKAALPAAQFNTQTMESLRLRKAK
jgi:sialate O-acetylesterase